MAYPQRVQMVHLIAVRRLGVPAIAESTVPATQEAETSRLLAKQYETVFVLRRFLGVPHDGR